LLDAGIVARREFEQAEADAARADAEAARAEARVRLYGAVGPGQRLALRAGVSGVVVERNINPGQELRPDQSGPGVPPVFVISDPSSLWVQIDAREADVAALKPGTPFELELPAWPGRRFPGKVTALADAIDPTTRTIKVRGLVNNPERLIKAEMLATAHLKRPSATGAVTVPSSAVLLRGEKHWVFVCPTPNVFEPREVQVGFEGQGETQVTQGLAPGAKVVTENNLLLSRRTMSTPRLRPPPPRPSSPDP
jgi:cobalt-zinc-cadmium efflux system membrane fusion protein